jgi:hypothetical protein
LTYPESLENDPVQIRFMNRFKLIRIMNRFKLIRIMNRFNWFRSGRLGVTLGQDLARF